MPYCEPWNAGLDSEPAAVARRLSRLLNALGTEINDHVIKRGELTEELRELRLKMIDKLRAEGWRVDNIDGKGWRVLVPNAKSVRAAQSNNEPPELAGLLKL